MRSPPHRLLPVLGLGLFLSIAPACDSCRDEPHAKLVGDDKLLAKVNGTTVSEYDVQRAIQSSFGKEGASTLDAAARQKVLESLVTSRVIAMARDKELDAQTRAALDKQVEAYREERLVKDYLAVHAPPAPVTEEMVEAYYQEHPDRFGAKKVRSYELVGSERELNGKERDSLLTALRDPGAKADWQAWADALKQQNEPIVFSQGRGNDGALHPKLRQAIESLPVGQASSLLFIQNRAYVVRVKSVDEEPPRPLAEVSGDIQEMLAPQQIKKALKTVSQQVLSKASVEYTKP